MSCVVMTVSRGRKTVKEGANESWTKEGGALEGLKESTYMALDSTLSCRL